MTPMTPDNQAHHEAIRMLPGEGVSNITSLKTQGRTGRRHQAIIWSWDGWPAVFVLGSGTHPCVCGEVSSTINHHMMGGSIAGKNKSADNLAQSFTTSMLPARSKLLLL